MVKDLRRRIALRLLTRPEIEEYLSAAYAKKAKIVGNMIEKYGYKDAEMEEQSQEYQENSWLRLELENELEHRQYKL